MGNVEHIRSKNRYRQVRLTYTESVTGTVSYAVHVKPLNAAWTEKTCVVRDSVRVAGTCESLDDVYATLAEIVGALRWSAPGD